jgi:hypothetical protein
LEETHAENDSNCGLRRGKEELPADLVQHIAGLIEFYEHDLGIVSRSDVR